MAGLVSIGMSHSDGVFRTAVLAELSDGSAGSVGDCLAACVAQLGSENALRALAAAVVHFEVNEHSDDMDAAEGEFIEAAINLLIAWDEDDDLEDDDE